jgi:hypothetical protein
MLPIFEMRSLGIVEQEIVVVPRFEIAGAMGGALLRGIAAIAELGIIARAAMRTG